jgi:PAS domain S-box-containing protein
MIFFSRDVQPTDADLLQMMVSVGSQIAHFMKRRQAENNLLESESHYRDICENANDLIQSVNIYGQFLYVNQTWCRTLGYSTAEIAHMNIFDIIHPDFQAYSRQLFSRLMLGEELEQVKTAFIAKNGQTVFVEGNINCKFVNGKPVATRCILRNITQRVSLEEALQNQPQPTEQLSHDRLLELTSNLLQSPDSIYVTILCADIVGLSGVTAAQSAMQLVNLLSPIFATFDRLSNYYGLEKLKTINDVYLVMAGLPTKRPDHAQAIAKMALEMQTAIAKFNIENQQNLKLGIAIHTGAVTADVTSLRDTINIARYIQSHSLADTIQVTATSYEQLCHEFLLEPQHEIEIAEQEKITTYRLLENKKKD